MNHASIPKIATSDDAEAAVAALTASYMDDPFMRWLFPDPKQYLRGFPSFALTFGGKALVRQSAFIAGNNYAAALWLPPGVRPDRDAITEFLGWNLAKDQQDAFNEVLERSARYQPAAPHWRLALMGVDPNYRRQRYGRNLLQYGLLACDAAHLPVYLEASPMSVALHQAEGFKILGEIRIGNLPPLVPMLRAAR